MGGATNVGGSDIFITRLTPTGELEWTKQIGTAGTEFAWAISNYSGGIYFSGYTSGVFDNNVKEGSYDAYVGALNTEGSLIWIKQFGTTWDDYAKGATINANGIYISGSTMGSFASTQRAGSDCFIAKMFLK